MINQQRNLINKLNRLICDARKEKKKIILIKLMYVDFMLIYDIPLLKTRHILGIPFKLDRKVFEITLIEG